MFLKWVTSFWKKPRANKLPVVESPKKRGYITSTELHLIQEVMPDLQKHGKKLTLKQATTELPVDVIKEIKNKEIKMSTDSKDNVTTSLTLTQENGIPQIKVAEPVNGRYYAMWEYDGQITATGPFMSQREARIWMSGFKVSAEDSDFRALGVVGDLVYFNDIEVVSPDLGK